MNYKDKFPSPCYPTLEKLTASIIETIEKKDFGTATNDLAFYLIIGREIKEVMDLGYLLANKLVEEALTLRGVSRIDGSHPEWKPEHLLETARNVYKNMNSPEDLEHNQIAYNALELLAKGEVGLALKFRRYTSFVEFSQEQYLEAGKVALEKGWIHEGLRAYRMANTRIPYESLKTAISAAERRISDGLPLEDLSNGESVNRYESEIRKAYKILLRDYPAEFIKDGLFHIVPKR